MFDYLSANPSMRIEKRISRKFAKIDRELPFESKAYPRFLETFLNILRAFLTVCDNWKLKIPAHDIGSLRYPLTIITSDHKSQQGDLLHRLHRQFGSPQSKVNDSFTSIA